MIFPEFASANLIIIPKLSAYFFIVYKHSILFKVFHGNLLIFNLFPFQLEAENEEEEWYIIWTLSASFKLLQMVKQTNNKQVRWTTNTPWIYFCLILYFIVDVLCNICIKGFMIYCTHSHRHQWIFHFVLASRFCFLIPFVSFAPFLLS